MSAVFLTGATGFLGTQLLQDLLSSGANVYALTRSKKRELPNHKNLTWVEGDIRNREILAHEEDRAKVYGEITSIIHAAALYDLEASHADLYESNAVGTHNMVHFAESCEKLEAFHYVSTMAIAGNFSGAFSEKMFNAGQEFTDHYASTKFAAENCVREWHTKVQRYIYRLGIVVGHSKTGFIPKVDGPYYLLRAIARADLIPAALKKLPFLPFPFDERARVYLVPVDCVSRAITTVSKDPKKNKSGLHIYHVMGETGGIGFRKVLHSFLKSFGMETRILAIPFQSAASKLSQFIDVPKETIPYMYLGAHFEMKNLAHDYPELTFPKFDEYAPNLIAFAKEKLFPGRIK